MILKRLKFIVIITIKGVYELYTICSVYNFNRDCSIICEVTIALLLLSGDEVIIIIIM